MAFIGQVANGVCSFADILPAGSAEKGLLVGLDNDKMFCDEGRNVNHLVPLWRVEVPLPPRARASLKQWLLDQRRHIRHRGRHWVHPALPEVRFEREAGRTSAGVFRVHFVGMVNGQEVKCLLPVDTLLEMLEAMERGP